MTGRKLLSRWVEQHESQAAAARSLGLSPQHLHALLQDANQGGMRRATARRISLVTGIPLRALLMLDEPASLPTPICTLPHERAEGGA